MAGGADPRWGVYVHVPWCHAVCPYCAFAVVAHRGDVDASAYANHLLHHLRQRRTSFPGRPTTLFFGGGTPSKLPLAALREIAAEVGATGEVSIEANPEDVDAAWLAGVVRAGITRVSLGVQSFDPARARRLGRSRSSAVAREAVRRVRDAVPTFSLDLMFAVPGKDEPLRRDLDEALALGAPHVSLYGLTIEDGTRFARAAARGALPAVGEEAWRSAYDGAVDTLRAAGLGRYEVSNFALPGHESAHNTLYWTDAPYLGLGPSAHSYLPDGVRTVDVGQLGGWLATPDGLASRERPDPREAATDLLVSALRSRYGVDVDHLRRRTGLGIAEVILHALEREGLVVCAGPRVRLTDAGFPVCDAVVAHLSERLGYP